MFYPLGDAKLQRSSYMGPPSNKMMINSYTYMRGPLEVGVTVTANTCVPVGEVVNGQTANGINVFLNLFTCICYLI